MQGAQRVLHRLELTAREVLIASVGFLTLRYLLDKRPPVGIEISVGAAVIEQLCELMQSVCFFGLQGFNPLGFFGPECDKLALKRACQALHGVAGGLKVRVYGVRTHDGINL